MKPARRPLWTAHSTTWPRPTNAPPSTCRSANMWRPTASLPSSATSPARPSSTWAADPACTPAAPNSLSCPRRWHRQFPRHARPRPPPRTASPLGVTYLHRDVAHQGPDPMTDHAFDLVIAIHLTPYATTHDELTGICRTARRALRTNGGRFVAACLNPDFNTTPGWYHPYGFDLTCTSTAEGAPVTLHGHLPGQEFRLTGYYWSTHAHETALAAAGFDHTTWHRPTVSPKAPVSTAPPTGSRTSTSRTPSSPKAPSSRHHGLPARNSRPAPKPSVPVSPPGRRPSVEAAARKRDTASAEGLSEGSCCAPGRKAVLFDVGRNDGLRARSPHPARSPQPRGN